MDISGKYESGLQKFILSCDSFTAAYSVMLLMFYAPHVFMSDQLVASAFLPLCCLLPFALMPIIYAAVHRFNPLLFGRYHLVMPLSAIIAALFFVLFWSAGEGASDACLMIFGGAIFCVASVTYRYCSFSVRVRLIGDSITKPSAMSRGFAAFGVAAALITVYFFYGYDPQKVLLNAAYIIGALGIILALAQYLGSFCNIPKLGGKRIQSIKSVFETFYRDINRRTYTSSLLFLAAYIAVAMLAVWYCVAAIEVAVMPIVAAALLAGSYFIVSLICNVFVKRRSKALSIVNITCLAVSCLLLIFIEPLSLTGGGGVACAVIACLSAGCGSAVALRQTRIRLLTIKPRVTSGTVYLLLELTVYAAAAIAVAVMAIIGISYVKTGNAVCFVYGFAIAVALGIAAFVTAGKRVVKADAGELAYEPTGDGATGGEENEDSSSDDSSSDDSSSDAETPIGEDDENDTANNDPPSADSGEITHGE